MISKSVAFFIHYSLGKNYFRENFSKNLIFIKKHEKIETWIQYIKSYCPVCAAPQWRAACLPVPRRFIFLKTRRYNAGMRNAKKDATNGNDTLLRYTNGIQKQCDTGLKDT
jgi:hypothetical protein